MEIALCRLPFFCLYVCKQDYRCHYRNNGSNRRYDTVYLFRLRIVLLLDEIIDSCAKDKQTNDDSYNTDYHVFFLHFNSNAEFMITRTEPALCTSAPITGPRSPVMARVMAIKFKVMENVRLILMVVIIRLERARR